MNSARCFALYILIGERTVRFNPLCFESKNVEVLFPARIRKKSKRERLAAFFALYSGALRKKHVERTGRQKIQKTITGVKTPLSFVKYLFSRRFISMNNRICCGIRRSSPAYDLSAYSVVRIESALRLRMFKNSASGTGGLYK